jgi:hypothetical protein
LSIFSFDFWTFTWRHSFEHVYWGNLFICWVENV